jgi:hypothetical protein
MGNMSKTRRWLRSPRHWLGMCGIGLALATLTGCQTWVTEAGVTLPSPYYLEHPAQYVPPSPPFPLSRELTSMEAGGVIAGAAAGAGQAAPAPQPPAGPVP